MNDITFKKSNILILRGVYIEDFTNIDDLFDNRFSEQAGKIAQQAPTIFIKLPKKFTGLSSWPKSSNLKCWNCDQFFSDVPKFIPFNPEKGKNNENTSEPHGNFCTFNCADVYIDEKFPGSQNWDLHTSLRLLYEIFTGRRIEKIIPAPSKTLMKQYCGEDEGITYKQYRDKIASLNSDYELSSYKLDHFKDAITQINTNCGS